jgi:hypothetical protein
VFFTCTYLAAGEFLSSDTSKGEILVFRKARKASRPKGTDEEAAKPQFDSHREVSENTITTNTEKLQNTSTFCWKNLCYDIKVKGQTRRILTEVNGWVQPGKITALMVRTS